MRMSRKNPSLMMMMKTLRIFSKKTRNITKATRRTKMEKARITRRRRDIRKLNAVSLKGLKESKPESLNSSRTQRKLIKSQS